MSGRDTLQGRRFEWVMAVVGMGLLSGGCAPKHLPYPYVPMHEAVRRVNENNAKVRSAVGGLRGSPVEATGRLREHEDARAHRFSFSGVLGFRPPRELILQLREGLGGALAMQAGSNDHEYWLWVRPEIDTLWWGSYLNPASEAPFGSGPSDDIPIRPDDLIEALGLRILPGATAGPDAPRYRPEPQRNVLIFSDREYYLDRAPPYLIREIVFREPDGRERMRATLSRDGRVRGSDAVAAHRIRVDWPSGDNWFELRIRRLTLETEPFPAPENPRTMGVRFKREIHVNSTADELAGVASGGAT